MNQQDRLFNAIGEVDPYLVARSEKRQRHWARYCLTAAACLAILLTAGRFWPQPEFQDPDNYDNPPLEYVVPDNRETFLPLPGSNGGTLRLLSYAPLSQEEAADFLIYVNEEQFYICEDNGLYRIRSTNPLPEDFPELGLDILHLPGTAPDMVKTDAENVVKDYYAQLTSEEMAAILPGSLYLRASNGTDWDSEQAELWFVEDGRGGTFVLISRYFLEAEEGMGTRFRDMASSFRVVPSDETVPDWMQGLYETTDRLFPALFSNDLSGISDLLAADADADAYGEDVWEYLSIASVDYMPDNDQDPVSAKVSVTHRLNLEEGESYSYLTMELVYQDGEWRLSWSGIEK